jgi:hypothetical protein
MASRWKQKYSARPGSVLNNSQAAIVGAWLDQMEAEKRAATPRALLKEATKSVSPLHKLFDWDERSAAAKHRLEFARQVIASVTIIDVRTAEPVRAMYSIVVDKGDRAFRAYERRALITASKSKLGQVSAQLWSRLLAVIVDAEGLGLGQSDPRWKRVIPVVRAACPPEAQAM